MVRVKFVAHPIPEILVPNIPGSKHYDPVKAGTKNDVLSTPLYVDRPTAFLAGPTELISVPFDQASVRHYPR